MAELELIDIQEAGRRLGVRSRLIILAAWAGVIRWYDDDKGVIVVDAAEIEDLRFPDYS